MHACWIGRWIHEHLVGARSSEKQFETEILCLGRREVDGPPPDGRLEWNDAEIKEGLTDLSRGERCATA